MTHGERHDRKTDPLRLMELRWQKDIIEQWLQASPVPRESRALLEEMLSSVDRQLADWEAEADLVWTPNVARLTR